MAKNKPRINKTKGKKWRKGQSCVSNPGTKKHRGVAMRMGQSSGPSNLTVDALSSHNDRIDEDGDIEFDVETNRSLGSISIGGLSDCSNPTFTRVKRHWQSQAAAHKEICAVLAAVTEVIKAQGGKETDTEYFAALMTALETAEGEASLTAISYLLSLVIKRVPVAVLRSKFSMSSQVILNILSTHIDSSASSLLRSLLLCLSGLLSSLDAATWQDSSTVKVYHGLLSFVVHSKPKVRKCAHGEVYRILLSPPSNTEYHPASQTTTKYCLQQMQSPSGSQQVTTLHIVNLVKDTLALLPSQNVKSLAEGMLKLMTLGNVMMVSTAMKALHGLFAGEPKPTTLPAQLNAQIITALYDYQPNNNDGQLVQAWLTVMESAHINLYKLDSKLCILHVPKLISTVMEFLLSEHADIPKASAQVAKNVLENCVEPVAEELVAETQGSQASKSCVHKLLRSLEGGLKYSYHAVWKHVLQILAVFFKIFGSGCKSLMAKTLVSLCDLRGSYRFPCQGELDKAVGVSVETMGPQFILQNVPLDLEKEMQGPGMEFPRSWLLPVLRDHTKNTEMKYFFDTLLPLAARLRARALKLYEEGGKDLEAKVYDTLQSQIWLLLPGFFTGPTDICESFKSHARVLGTALTERKDLRLTVCQALRTIIQKTKTDEETAEVGRFAKNFLPILFNIYTAEAELGDPEKLPVLSTLKTYLTIADRKLINTFISKAVAKVQEESSLSVKHCVMDLLIAMTEYGSQESLSSLYNVAVPLLKSTDVTMQKKGYRVLEELCAANSDAAKEFVHNHLEEMQNTLLKNLSSSNQASKAPRLKCLSFILNHLTAEHRDFIVSIIPEVILCVKEVAAKARSAALSLVVEIAEILAKFSETSKQESISVYIQYLIAGLAGSGHMISATIIALSKLVYEYRYDLAAEVVDQLIKTVANFLTSKVQEVVKATMDFFKVIVVVLKPDDLVQYVEEMISKMLALDGKHHYRYKVKVILEKLIRKYGFELVAKFVPEKHKKLVIHVKKTTDRAKRNKIQQKQSRQGGKEKEEETIQSYDDLMFGLEEEFEGEEKHKKKDKKTVAGKKPSKTGKAWIKEGDEPMDFLDAGVVKQIVATDPKKARSRGGDGEFETSTDGKLIIPGDDEDGGDDQESSGNKKRRNTEDDEDDIDFSKQSRKRKKRDYEDDDDGDGERKKSDRGGASSAGSEFRAKKAGGDIKKKGQHDPYAYVPLKTHSLNKRKRAKASGQFRGLVQAARKGASKGQKQFGKQQKGR